MDPHVNHLGMVLLSCFQFSFDTLFVSGKSGSSMIMANLFCLSFTCNENLVDINTGYDKEHPGPPWTPCQNTSKSKNDRLLVFLGKSLFRFSFTHNLFRSWKIFDQNHFGQAYSDSSSLSSKSHRNWVYKF